MRKPVYGIDSAQPLAEWRWRELLSSTPPKKVIFEHGTVRVYLHDGRVFEAPMHGLCVYSRAERAEMALQARATVHRKIRERDERVRAQIAREVLDKLMLAGVDPVALKQKRRR